MRRRFYLKENEKVFLLGFLAIISILGLIFYVEICK